MDKAKGIKTMRNLISKWFVFPVLLVALFRVDAVFAKNALASSEGLRTGEGIVSENRAHALIMQEDGNLVIYTLGKPTWSSKTNGRQVESVVMQDDGNLVIYAPGGGAVWNTRTNGNGPSDLIMQDDGNLVIYRKSDGKHIWNTKTNKDPSIYEKVKAEIPRGMIEGCRGNATCSNEILFGIECQTSPPEEMIPCIAAAIVIAALMEFSKEEPWGKGNEIRVIGGNISIEAKNAAVQLKKLGGGISNEYKKLVSIR